MTKNKSVKMLSYLMSFMLILAVVFAANTVSAFAASTDPVTGIYPCNNISGKDSRGNTVTETKVENRLTSLSKSLWYNDSSSIVKSVITVYDNGGSVKYGGDVVTVTIRRLGQGSGGKYVMIDGNSKGLPGKTKVVSAFPYPFIEETTYEVKRSYAAPGAEYTILTVGHIGTAPAGSSTPHVRYEANVYIYWDNAGNATASVLPSLPKQMMWQTITDKIVDNVNC